MKIIFFVNDLITINIYRFDFKEFIKNLIIELNNVFVKSAKNRFKGVKVKCSI